MSNSFPENCEHRGTLIWVSQNTYRCSLCDKIISDLACNFTCPWCNTYNQYGGTCVGCQRSVTHSNKSHLPCPCCKSNRRVEKVRTEALCYYDLCHLYCHQCRLSFQVKKEFPGTSSSYSGGTYSTTYTTAANYRSNRVVKYGHCPRCHTEVYMTKGTSYCTTCREQVYLYNPSAVPFVFEGPLA